MKAETMLAGYNKYRSRTWIGAVACFFLIIITLAVVVYLGHIKSPAVDLVPVEAIVFLSFTIIGAFYGKSILKGVKLPQSEYLGEVITDLINSDEDHSPDITPNARSNPDKPNNPA